MTSGRNAAISGAATPDRPYGTARRRRVAAGIGSTAARHRSDAGRHRLLDSTDIARQSAPIIHRAGGGQTTRWPAIPTVASTHRFGRADTQRRERGQRRAWLVALSTASRWRHTRRMSESRTAITASEHPVSTPDEPQRLKNAALAFGFWTLLALSYALSGGLSAISEGNPPNWSRALVWSLGNFWLWMALVPLIGWLGRRGAGDGWLRFCLVHVPAALGLALLQMLAHLVAFWYVSGPGRMPVHTCRNCRRCACSCSRTSCSIRSTRSPRWRWPTRCRRG
jgi:hypothetical protein